MSLCGYFCHMCMVWRMVACVASSFQCLCAVISATTRAAELRAVAELDRAFAQVSAAKGIYMLRLVYPL